MPFLGLPPVAAASHAPLDAAADLLPPPSSPGVPCLLVQDGCESGSGVLLTVFHGQRAPPISILDYLVRMAKYTKCSPACFVHALVHMMRLAEGGPGYRPTSLNVHRLLLTSVLLSAKFLDDRYFNNAFYAKVRRGQAYRHRHRGSGRGWGRRTGTVRRLAVGTGRMACCV